MRASHRHHHKDNNPLHPLKSLLQTLASVFLLSHKLPCGYGSDIFIQEKAAHTSQAQFYRTFGRPIFKVFLLAIFTYQLAYYFWVRLEQDEIKSEMRGMHTPYTRDIFSRATSGIANTDNRSDDCRSGSENRTAREGAEEITDFESLKWGRYSCPGIAQRDEDVISTIGTAYKMAVHAEQPRH